MSAVPKRTAARLAAAARAERAAARAHERARLKLARELAAANDHGHTVRTLAPLVKLTPSKTHRLIIDSTTKEPND